MAVSQIMERISKIHNAFPAKWVCLTGGEPFLQKVEVLVRRLKNEGYKIQVETNATIYRPMAANWYTVSPKPPKYLYQPIYKKKAKEVKIVVTRGLEFRVLKKLRQEFAERIPVLLQPQSNRKWSVDQAKKLLKQSLEENLENIRLSVQIHKIYGWR